MARDAARRPQGLGRGARPADRRDPRVLELSRLRPEPARRATTRPAAPDGRERCSTRAPTSRCWPQQYQERYFPGSTFKVVTGSIGRADRHGHARHTRSTRGDRRTRRPRRPGRSATSAARRAAARCSRSSRVSCNTAFAQMGAETIGPPTMIAGAAGRSASTPKPPIDLPAPAAVRCSRHDFDATTCPRWPSRRSARTTCRPRRCRWRWSPPAIANGGVIMKPHVMTEIRDDDGNGRRALRPRRRGCSADQPADAPTTMREAMIGVVAARHRQPRLQIPGVEVGGKTGTAQLGTDPPTSHAWIIGFAGPPGDAAGRGRGASCESQPGRQRGHRRPGGGADRPSGHGRSTCDDPDGGSSGAVRRVGRRATVSGAAHVG